MVLRQKQSLNVQYLNNCSISIVFINSLNSLISFRIFGIKYFVIQKYTNNSKVSYNSSIKFSRPKRHINKLATIKAPLTKRVSIDVRKRTESKAEAVVGACKADVAKNGRHKLCCLILRIHTALKSRQNKCQLWMFTAK